MAVSRFRLADSTPILVDNELLESKLRAPRPRGARVERPRLLQLLSAAREDPVTLVIAPAGYGKSTLLSQWALANEQPVAWISLAPGDNNTVVFMSYLGAAVRSINPALTRIGDEAHRYEQGKQDQLVTTLLNDLEASGEPFTLVLDDYHVIESPEIHEVVQALIDHAPDGFRLVICSRTEPPFPLARRRLLGQLTTITMDELRFTLSETIAFCKLSGLTLREDELATLHEVTAGWAAGIKMAALSMVMTETDARDFFQRLGTTGQLLEDFLIEEVLNKQPPEVREALLITSLFDRFSADLYRAVNDDEAAVRAFNNIVRANLFIVPLDQQGEWYSYQHLFQEILRRRAVVDMPEATRVEIYQRAGAWFEQRGMTADAISLAISCREWQRAADLIVPIAYRAIRDEDLVSFTSWMRMLPEEVLTSHAWLSQYFAWASMRTGESPELEHILARAERTAEAYDDLFARGSIAGARVLRARYQEDVVSTARRLEQCDALLSQCADQSRERQHHTRTDESSELFFRSLVEGIKVQRGAVLRMQGHAREAEQASNEARASALFEELPFTAGTATVELGIALMQQGRLDEALQEFQVARTSQSIFPSERRLAMVYLADILRERGQIEDAQQMLDESLALANQLGVRTWLPQTHLARARLARDRGDDDAAIACAEEAISATSGFAYDRLRREAQAFIIATRLGHGDLGAALKWMHESRLAPDDEPDYAFLREHLVYARALIAQGDPEDAIGLLDRLLAVALDDGRTGDAIAILVQLATGYQDMIELDKAVAAIDRALRMAEPGRYLRVFTAEGQPMARLLKVAQRRGALSNYCQYLLSAMGEELQPPPKLVHPELIEPITARELEVLQLIAVGLTNREISNELFISVSTVKRHVTNLYGKLGVPTRTKALQEARRLGLLKSPLGHT